MTFNLFCCYTVNFWMVKWHSSGML